MAPVATSDIVDIAIANLGVAVEDCRATIERPSELPVVSGNTGELIRLLQNLIANALKYRAPDRAPVVTLSCRDENGEWVFAVKDNGIGIAPDYFNRIFMVFQRLHDRGTYEGTGIGLAVCKKIIERHGGRIWVESIPGEGSTFSFTLPKRHAATQ
jgi:light-regulated signal transduction histidine kinase (bacteriophytochrome)